MENDFIFGPVEVGKQASDELLNDTAIQENAKHEDKLSKTPIKFVDDAFSVIDNKRVPIKTIFGESENSQAFSSIPGVTQRIDNNLSSNMISQSSLVEKSYENYIPSKQDTLTKREALFFEPNLKVEDKIKEILKELFFDFLKTDGKFRDYLEFLPQHGVYCVDANPPFGTHQIYFEVWNRNIKMHWPSIQIVLGNPVQITDLNRGIEHSPYSVSQKRSLSRYFYNINCQVYIQSLDNSTTADLARIFNDIVTKHLRLIYSGTVMDQNFGWQMIFPYKLEPSDVISQNVLMNAKITNLYTVEMSMPLFFEQCFLDYHGAKVRIGGMYFGIPGIPYIETNKNEISIGEECIVTLRGRKDTFDGSGLENIKVSNCFRASIKQKSRYEYIVKAKSPGIIKVRALYSKYPVSEILIKIN